MFCWLYFQCFWSPLAGRPRRGLFFFFFVIEEPAVFHFGRADGRCQENKVELADEEVERMSVVAQVAKQDGLRLAAKQRQLQNRRQLYIFTTPKKKISEIRPCRDMAVGQNLGAHTRSVMPVSS